MKFNLNPACAEKSLCLQVQWIGLFYVIVPFLGHLKVLNYALSSGPLCKKTCLGGLLTTKEHPCSQISAFDIGLLENIISRYATSENSIF